MYKCNFHIHRILIRRLEREGAPCPAWQLQYWCIMISPWWESVQLPQIHAHAHAHTFTFHNLSAIDSIDSILVPYIQTHTSESKTLAAYVNVFAESCYFSPFFIHKYSHKVFGSQDLHRLWMFMRMLICSKSNHAYLFKIKPKYLPNQVTVTSGRYMDTVLNKIACACTVVHRFGDLEA